MEARHLAKILQQACLDGNMFDGPHTKRPDISIALHPDGLHLSSWWNEMYCFKIISWESIILSHGDAIKGAINAIRSTQTDGEWKNDDVESTVGANTDVQSV